MQPWSEGSLNINGNKIHYYRTGVDKPPVVFNHGAGDDGLCWTHVVRELVSDYDIIMPDARGHGKSGSGNGDYSVRQRVADLAGLLEAVKLDRPVVGGHSMGAETSLHLAAIFPHLTRGVFLEDPPIFLPGEKFGSGAQEVKVEEVGKMMAKFMRMFKLLPKFVGVRLARKTSPTYPEDEIIPWVNSKRRVSFNFLNSLPKMELHAGDSLDVFGRLTVPTLLFIGDREKMAIVSEETARAAANLNEKVRLVHLEGASHDIRRTRFDGYLPALREFLAEIYQS